MTDVEQRILDGWTHLDGSVHARRGSTGSWLWFDTGLGRGDNAYVLGVDDSGTNHLFIRCESDDDFPGPSKGHLEIDKTFLELGIAAPSWFLDIRCGSPTLARQFRTVVSDVVDRTLTSANPAREALAIVAEWRALFAQLPGSSRLTFQRRMSLFAELSTLMEIAKAAGELDLNWWRGPYLEPHDVEHPAFSLEVKAIGIDSTNVTIHGPEQLSPLNGKPLILHIATVAESDTGESLESLCRRVIQTARSRNAARIALIRAGISEQGNPNESTRFVISDTTTVHVDEMTPRITPDMFPTGIHPAITGIRYEVDLPTLSGRASEASLGSVIEELL